MNFNDFIALLFITYSVVYFTLVLVGGFTRMFYKMKGDYKIAIKNDGLN